jgi:hypothetical protein
VSPPVGHAAPPPKQSVQHPVPPPPPPPLFIAAVTAAAARAPATAPRGPDPRAADVPARVTAQQWHSRVPLPPPNPQLMGLQPWTSAAPPVSGSAPAPSLHPAPAALTAALQRRRAQTPQRGRNARPPRQAQEADDEASTDDEAQRYGVTAATNRRRLRTTNEFLSRLAGSEPTAKALRDWGLEYSVGTRLSYLTTVIAELRRRQITVSGDVPGVVREAKIALMAHHPQQATPLTPDAIAEVLLRTTDDEHYAIMMLMWKTASRLTSITQLETVDVTPLKDRPDVVRMTFRRGKTIISTGPYTLWAEVDDRTLSYIESRRAQREQWLCKKRAEQLYGPLGAILREYQIRSFRRGALQQIASVDVTPDDLRIISRHTTNQSLYRYLDHGAASKHEQNTVLNLTRHL